MRKSLPTKRPTRPSLTDRGMLAPGAAKTGGDLTIKPDVEGFLREFEAGLRDQPDLSEHDRELIQREFADTLRATAVAQENGTDIEPSDWIQTVRLLERDGMLDGGQGGDLIRQLEAAMQPFQEPDVQLAIEFGRRCRVDGKEKALEWYRAQTDAGQKLTSVPSDREAPRPTVSEVKSRARRVRGPPVG